jgi:pimeloyl-ACP methyl ester carboxylesterase
MAGNTIPLVAARRPVTRLVYLCGLAADPGRSLLDQFAEDEILFLDYQAGITVADGVRSVWTDVDLAREILYADCAPADVEAAIVSLRPQSATPYAVPCPLDALPDVPVTYVLCSEDRLVRPDWSRRVARERLGAELVELLGSHSPFLSRPGAIADVLEACAA